MALSNNFRSEKKQPEVKLVEVSDAPGGVNLISVHKSTKTASPNDLVELAQVIQRGNEGVYCTAVNKLSVIADQMRFLQEQARQVLKKASRDSELHAAACNIVKKPGTIYYWYERESGQKYLSIISPEEWGPSVPRKYCGGFRLEFDMSWTPIDDIRDKDEEYQLLDSVINSKQGIFRAAICMDKQEEN